MAIKSNVKYDGREEWVNTSTGEIVEVDRFKKRVGRDEPFMITYLCEIINFIDVLGNRKMKVVKYILRNMQKSNNTLIITHEELAQKTNVSRKTVSETMKILSNADIVKNKKGAIMINPKLMNNKKPKGEAAMMIQFEEFGK